MTWDSVATVNISVHVLSNPRDKALICVYGVYRINQLFCRARLIYKLA